MAEKQIKESGYSGKGKLNQMRQQIAETFIASLKEGTIPWRKNWKSIERSHNAVSGTEYRGINLLWLSCVAMQKDYNDPRWCTYKQAKDSGWQVRKGEKGTKIEFWSMYDVVTKQKLMPEEVKLLKADLKEKFFDRVKPISSVYTVFNAAQISGIPERTVERVSFPVEELLEQRDVLLKNMNLDFHEGGDRAFYRSSDDSVTMPKIDQFYSAYGYMGVFLHESGHATGHASRLNRNLSGSFGSEDYAREELRAEIASAFTAQALGLDNTITDHLENHTAYIQNWCSVLEQNPNELFAAIRDAEEISDYLMEKGGFNLDAWIRERVPEGRTSNLSLDNLEQSLLQKAIGRSGTNTNQRRRHQRSMCR